MLKLLFPITANWSWLSFFLYIIIGVIVCYCCKSGAISNAKYKELHDNKYRVNGKLWYYIAFFVLVIFSTIRSYEVGPDTETYVYIFQAQSSIHFRWDKLLTFNQYEPGFQYFNYIARRITQNYHFYFFIVYSFVAYSYISYIKKFYTENSNYIFLLLFSFYYYLNLSGIRGSIGVAFLLLSYVKTEEKKFVQALILTFLGITFHYTMVFNLYVIAVVFVLNNKKMENKRWLWLLGIIIITYISMVKVSSITGVFADTKYSNYSLVSMEDKSLLGSIFYLFSAINCIFCYKEFSCSEYKKNKQFVISLAFLISYPALFVASAYRIPNYYIMPRLVIWDDSIQIISRRLNIRYSVLKSIAKIIVFIYLLFRFTRAAVDGHFTYIVDF